MNTRDVGKVVWVYMTAGSMAEARRIAKTLVSGRLAACVNILGAMESVYSWQGKVRKGREVALVAKTVTGRRSELVRTVRSLHSYECPCIVCLPVNGGNPEFLRWIRESVK